MKVSGGAEGNEGHLDEDMVCTVETGRDAEIQDTEHSETGGPCPCLGYIYQVVTSYVDCFGKLRRLLDLDCFLFAIFS